MIRMRLRADGIKEAREGIKAILESISPQSVYRNYLTVGRWMVREVKDRTPGKGNLRAAWKLDSSITFDRDNRFTATYTVSNTKENERVFYTNIQGKRKPSLKADDTQLTWGEVIHFLDVGTKAHVIRPRRAKALAFKVKRKVRRRGSNQYKLKFRTVIEDVFAQSVYHPGTRRYGMLSKTVSRLERVALLMSDRLLERAAQAWQAGRSTITPPGLSGEIYVP